MLYNNKDIMKKYKTRYKLKKAIDDKEIYKLDNGIYSDEDLVDPMIVASKKYSNGIITMDSAFYYYDLTDVVPEKTYVATSRNSNTIKKDYINQIKVPKERLNQGVDIVKIDGEEVRIYNRERLLVELIRKRKQMPFDYYKEIVGNYRRIVEDLDMRKIEEYILLYKNSLNLSDALLREVF